MPSAAGKFIPGTELLLLGACADWWLGQASCSSKISRTARDGDLAGGAEEVVDFFHGAVRVVEGDEKTLVRSRVVMTPSKSRMSGKPALSRCLT